MVDSIITHRHIPRRGSVTKSRLRYYTQLWTRSKCPPRWATWQRVASGGLWAKALHCPVVAGRWVVLLVAPARGQKQWAFFSGLGDFEDNCPADWNNPQSDADGDSMGDDCDPEPFTAPAGICTGGAASFTDTSTGTPTAWAWEGACTRRNVGAV